MYEILPATRTWPPLIEACAQALLDGASDRDEEAALSLLFRDPQLVFARDDIVEAYVDGLDAAHMDWWSLSIDAESNRLPLSSGERALVLLACSMATTACHVKLSDAFGSLDAENQQAFIDAMAYAAGMR